MSDKVISSLTAARERQLLNWLAQRMPDWVTPNMMTAVGASGGVIAALGYILSSYGRWWLLVACLGLFLHWFGDSLDGTIARTRSIERPRFGMFLDQCVDIATVALIFFGLGWSPWVRFDVASLFIIGYLMLVSLTHLRSNVMGTYDIAYGGLGPTEGRLFLLAVTVLMMIIPPIVMNSWPVPMTSFDHIFIGMALWTMVNFAIDARRVLKQLALMEPPRAHAKRVDL